MRVFEISRGEATGSMGYTRLDLDHVVYFAEHRSDNEILWWVQTTASGFFVTKACFDRMMRAWEST